MSRRARRIGLLAAGILAAAGLALRVAPARLPAADIAPPEPYTAPHAPTGTERAATLLSYNVIAAANLFAPERAAPAERYTPPELAADSPAPAVPAGPASAPAAPAFRLRLVGTAVGPEASVALIDADPAIPGAEVFRIGDRIGQARVVEIHETTVVLEGPQGRITLSLPSPVRRSP